MVLAHIDGREAFLNRLVYLTVNSMYAQPNDLMDKSLDVDHVCAIDVTATGTLSADVAIDFVNWPFLGWTGATPIDNDR